MAVQARGSITSGSSANRRSSKLAPFYGTLRIAARRVRLERTVSVAIRLLPPAVLLSAAWVVLLRFTLVDLPQWPALIPLLVWSVALVVVMSRTRVTTAHSARYLDHTLGLDERLATFVELLSRQHRGVRSSSASTHIDALADSAMQLMRLRWKSLPGVRARASRAQLILLGACTVALALAIMVPTPVDAARLEKQKLAQSISAQLQRVEELRADFVARPQIPDATRAALLAELDRLEAKLKTPGVDQASLLAAISDAQERLREVSPDLSSDFDPVIRAAQMIQDTVLRYSPWKKADSKSNTELGRAADASDFLSSYVTSETVGEAFAPAFTLVQQVSASRGFDGASGVLSTRDGALARLLQDTAAALKEKTLDHASQLLATVATELRKAEGRQQGAEAVEHALSSLDDSKQSIAQTTETKQKKAQVGFRRGQPGSADATATAVAAQVQRPSTTQTPGGNPAGSGGQTGPSAPGDPTSVGNQANPGIGQNMPSLGGSNPGGVTGNQPSNPGDTSGQTGDGSGGGNPKAGTPGNQSSSGDNSQGGDSSGKLTGPITGPGGGVSGDITKVENPEGTGISSGDSSGPKNQDGTQDNVTVPVDVSEGSSEPGNGISATPVPETGGSDSGIVGGVSPGGNSSQSGGGTTTTIQTPFTEVLGQYAKRAAAALDREYIPQDAKEYVRDYFTELGK